LPSEASIDLPKVQVSAEYITDESTSSNVNSSNNEGPSLSKGSYLKAEAEIGELEHFLTTDLLNHLVFVQKVYHLIWHMHTFFHVNLTGIHA